MKKTLYLGLDPSNCKAKNLIHYPIIKIVKRDFKLEEIKSAFTDIDRYTHIIFTSKTTVDLFFDALKFFQIDIKRVSKKHIIAIGPATAARLKQKNFSCAVAEKHTQEGIIDLLKEFTKGYIFYPRSSLARDTLLLYLQKKSLPFVKVDLYDTKINRLKQIIDFKKIQEIIFTSPSTVDSFIKIFGKPPRGIKLSAIGPITKQRLVEKIFT